MKTYVNMHILVEPETRTKLRQKFAHGYVSERVRTFLDELLSEVSVKSEPRTPQQSPKTVEKVVQKKPSAAVMDVEMNPVMRRFLERNGEK